MKTDVKKKIMDCFSSVFGRLCVDRNHIPVIYYHDVVCDNNKARSYMRITLEKFESHMYWLKNNGYKTLLFDELPDMINKKPDDKTVIITFDDGWQSNYQYVFPLMKKLGLKFNVFLTSSYVDKGNPEYLSWNQVKEMYTSGFVGFGSHTCCHTDCTKINSEEEICNEILECDRIIYSKANIKIHDFCFPYGYYNKEIISKIADTSDYKRIYTSAIVDPVIIDDTLILGRVAISADDNIKVFSDKIKGYHRIHGKYLDMIGHYMPRH